MIRRNKKGDYEWIIIFIIVIFGLVFWAMYVVWDGEAKTPIEKESCSKIGMEYYYTGGTQFCVDNDNQAHYVKFECEHYGCRKWECNPRIISIGDIRTLQVGEFK